MKFQINQNYHLMEEGQISYMWTEARWAQAAVWRSNYGSDDKSIWDGAGVKGEVLFAHGQDALKWYNYDRFPYHKIKIMKNGELHGRAGSKYAGENRGVRFWNHGVKQ